MDNSFLSLLRRSLRKRLLTLSICRVCSCCSLSTSWSFLLNSLVRVSHSLRDLSSWRRKRKYSFRLVTTEVASNPGFPASFALLTVWKKTGNEGYVRVGMWCTYLCFVFSREALILIHTRLQLGDLTLQGGYLCVCVGGGGLCSSSLLLSLVSETECVVPLR